MPAADSYPIDETSLAFRMYDEAHQQEVKTRAAVYTRNWAYYRGEMHEPLKLQPDGVNDNVILALVDQIADSVVSFLLGDGIEFDATQEGEEQGSENDASDKAIADLWQQSRGDLLQHNLALTGAICGHCAVRIEPREGQPARLVRIDPSHFAAFWQADDVEKVLWYRLQYRLGDAGAGKRIDYINDLALGGTDNNTWSQVVYRIPTNGQRWVKDGPPERIEFCPIVDWQNLPSPQSYYGQDDVARAVALNDALNFAGSNFNRILKHYGSPKTIGIGFDAENISIQPGDLVTIKGTPGGIPPDVKLLEMQSDLASIQNWIGLIERYIWRSARLVDPQSFKDKVGAITNFGLRVMFLDALRKTQTKRTLYGEGLAKVCQIGLLASGQPVPATVRVLWPDILPENQAETSQAIIAELGAGLIDKHTARERLGYDAEQVEKRLEEEEAGQDDIGSRLLAAFEKGGPPSGAQRQVANSSASRSTPGVSP